MKRPWGVGGRRSPLLSPKSPYPLSSHPLQQESNGGQQNWRAGPLHILVIWILIGKDDPGAEQSLRPLALIWTATHMQSLSDVFKDSPV